VTAGFLQVVRDRERLRDLVIDANDGIVAIAGVVEGVLAAGLGNRAAATAVVVATIAGGISIGGSRYTEEAAERDAQHELLEEERHQLQRSPEQELDELTAFYEAKGLAPDLARVVAIASGLVFALGALVVVVTAVLTPSSWRVPTTFIAVTLALALTSIVVARWGEVPLGRTLARNVIVGVTAMAVSFAIGSLLET
jgi:VIT1/CCC1 family predicted Fe2+/Mn2+ transporter